MIVAILDGWSSSKKVPMSGVFWRIWKNIYPIPRIDAYYSDRAFVIKKSAKKCMDFIKLHQNEGQDLLCVGKSLGAKQMICDVLNDASCANLRYRRVRLVTVDPCWPLLFSWRPNLNDRWLELKNDEIVGENVFCSISKSEQAGSRVRGKNIKNIRVKDCSHFAVSNHIATRIMIRKRVKELSNG